MPYRRRRGQVQHMSGTPCGDSEQQESRLRDGDIAARRDSVVCTELDSGELVLLDLDSKFYYSANETGRTVWGLIDGRRSVGEIVSATVQAYEGDAAQIQDAVMEFLHDLLAEGLIVVRRAERRDSRHEVDRP